MESNLEAARQIVCALIADIQNQKRSIKVLDAETLWNVTHQRTIDVKTLDARSLVIWDRILMFWNADAVIRLSGTKEPKETWQAVYHKALEVSKNLNIDTLATVLLQTGDTAGIAGLIALRLDRFESQSEINERIRAIPTLENFLKIVDNDNVKSSDIDELADQATKRYNSWVRDINNDPSKPHLPEAEKINKNADTSVERGKKLNKDSVNEIAAHYFAAYRQLQKQVSEAIEVVYVPSPISTLIPCQAWERVAPEIWKKNIASALHFLEPGIKEDNTETWQKVPYRSFNPYIKNTLKDFKTLPFHIEDTHKDGKSEIVERADKYADDYRRSEKDEKEAEALAVVFLEKIVREITKEEKSRKIKEILETFHLVKNGFTLKDASTQAGISESLAKKYLRKIKDKRKQQDK